MAEIDTSRRILENPDGSFSTERTITIESDGKHLLIPTILNGAQLQPQDAIEAWRIGANPEVGAFDSAEEAERAAVARSAQIGQVRSPDRRPQSVGGMLEQVANVAPRRTQQQAATTLMPWAEVEARPEFQNLSAHGKRLAKTQYLAEAERVAGLLYKKDKDKSEFVQGVLSVVPEFKDPTRTVGDWLNDLNLSIQSGVAAVTGSVGEVGRMIGVGGEGFEGDPTSLGNLFNPDAQEALRKTWQTQKSAASQDFQKFKAEREAAARAEGGGEVGAGKAVLGAYAKRPSEALLSLAEQVPVIGSFIGPGGLARGAAVLPRARAALAGLESGAMTAEQAAAAIVAAERAGVTAGRLTTGTLGATLESADAKQTFIERMTSLGDDVWQADPEFQQAVAAGQDPKAVKKRLAEERSGWATGIGAVLGVFDGISGFERLFIGPAVAGIRRRLLSGAAEPLVESLQGINPLAVANLQAQGMDPKIAFTQGFGPAVAESLVVAGPFGVAAAAFPGAPVVPTEGGPPAPPPGAAPAAGPAAPPPGAPPTAPAEGAPATVGPIPSAMSRAAEARQAAQAEIAEADRVRGDGNSTPQEVAAAEAARTSAEGRIAELDRFEQAWNNVEVIREVQRDIGRDEARIAEINADQRADPDSAAREIAALEGRIERNRQLQEVNALDENELQAYIDSRNKSLAAASGERGLGITVDRGRLTNEIGHAQRLLEERAEIPTPAEVEFAQRAPTVFTTDAAGVPNWPSTAEIERLPFIDAMNLQRDRALSLINLVRGNKQFTRSQRATAIGQARSNWEAMNRIAEAWNLSDEELQARYDDLVQSLGAGFRGATTLNQGHFLELAGVIASQAARKGTPMTWRQAQLEAQKTIAAIYVPPTVIGPGGITGGPKAPAGDTNQTRFYDDDPIVSGGRVLGRTPSDAEKKLWDNAIKALAKLGFNKSMLDALGLRIATSEYALGLYLPSSNDARNPNISYTLSVSWGLNNGTQEQQWTAIHEISHALADSQRNGTDIAEVDPRFLPTGEFRAELAAAYQNGNGPLQKLHYPLSPTWNYGPDAIAAELWAQANSYYFLDRNLLKQHAPKTFAFVESFHANNAGNQFTTRLQVAAAVRGHFSGVPVAAPPPAGQAPAGGAGPAAPGAGPGPTGPPAAPAGTPSGQPRQVGRGEVLADIGTAIGSRSRAEQLRIIDDAINAVQAEIAGQPGAVAPVVQGAVGGGAAPVAAAVQGEPRAEAAAGEAGAARERRAEAETPRALARPVRPAAERGRRLGRAGDQDQAGGLAEPQAAGAGAGVETPQAARKLTRAQRRIADEIVRLEDLEANILNEMSQINEVQEEITDEAQAEEIENILRQLGEALAQVRNDKNQFRSDLADVNRMRERVPNPTTAVRLQEIIGRILGIDPKDLARRVPAIEFATTGDIDPRNKTLTLRGGVVAGGADPSVLAFYLPNSNRVVFFVDNIRKGEEASVILHELFHKRARQLLGTETMNRLKREALRWKDAPVGSIERSIYDKAMPQIMAGIEQLPKDQQRAAFQEELLPYFITEAVRQGVRPDPKAMKAPTAEGWLTRIKAAFEQAVAKVMGRKPDPAQFGVKELMAAAWGAAQLERGSLQYELMARGQPVSGPIHGEAAAAGALMSSPIFERRLAQLKQRVDLFVPELRDAQERKVYSRRAANAQPLNDTQIQAVRAAPAAQVQQAATAPPAVGPAQPQKSIVERFKPSEARPIRNKEDLDNFMRTGNRPTIEWMEQTRDRTIENYVDHQRPFLAWLKRHVLPMAAWAKLKLVPGRLKARSDAYQRELLAPIERKVAAFSKQLGIPYDQAALDAGWLPTLQHIKEANAALRKKLVDRLVAGEPGAAENLALFDRTQRGALKPGEQAAPMAGGLTDADAAMQLQHLAARYTPEQMTTLQGIADDIVGAFATLKNDAVQSGQISRDALKNFPKFQRYVALTGPNQGVWDDQVSDGFGSYIAENRLREREGRTTSVSENALEALAERVGRVSAYDASREFKSELNDIWTRAGGDQNTIGLRRFTANLVQSPKRSDIVWNAPDGKRYVFRFEDGETVGESLLGKNREYHDTLGLKIMDYLTRKFSRAVTQWIPAFGPINAMRDVQEKAILIRSRDVKDANGKAVDPNQLFKKTWAYAISPDTWRAAKQLAFGASKRAQENTAIGRYSNELINEGGVSTWGEITRKGLASIEEAIKQEAARAGLAGGATNSLQKVQDFVRNYNLMFEVVSALSVNAAMRDLNVAPKDAAFQTLDLMNFQNVGARSGWLRAAFAFFNPAAQSGYNLYRQIVKSPRGRRDFFGLLAFSFFLQGILRMLADDDEDLGNELDQRGTWETDRNIPVNLLGVPLKIPVGFGAPQFAWSIMNSGYRWLSGRYDTADAVVQGGISTLKSFNPIPISEVGPTKQPINFLLKTFTPTVFRPALDFVTDSDAWGGKLTAYYPDKTKFRSEQGRPTTSVFYKDLAEGLQGLGLDLYPEQVKAISEAVAWGPYGYLLQGVADSNKENEGRRLNPMDRLPASAFLKFMGVSRFVGGESRYLEARYYENYDRALDDLREFNRAKADGREAKWRSENPERMRRVEGLQKQERVMRGLSKDFNTAVRDLQNEKINVEQARPVLERIQNQREAAMREFLRNLKVWDEEEGDE
jgi:hypothetical protein